MLIISLPLSLLLKVGQTDVTVGVMIGGARFLFLERMVISPPAVSPVGCGGGEPHLVAGEPGLAVCRGQRVAEELRGVESPPGGVSAAAPVDGGPGVGHLALSLRVVPQVVVRVGVAGQRPVGGTASLERAGSPRRAGAPVSSDLSCSATAAPGAADTAASGLHRSAARPPVAVPAADTGLAAAAAVSDVVVNPRVPGPGGLPGTLGPLGAADRFPVRRRGVGGVVAVAVGVGPERQTKIHYSLSFHPPT